ncbi:hypothetical protein BGZ80_006581, partial [Entomortierella chlamydospora]
MPITFSPSKISAGPFRSKAKKLSRRSLFQEACNDQYNRSDEILQSSFQGLSDIVPKTNGFVHTVIHAYNRHRALIIRPDDVWTAILVQFSFFVNGNAELLRSQFVSHEGQKTLRIEGFGDRYTMDFGKMAQNMTIEIDRNVVDPSLREWILPNFTTTTDNDTIISSVVMMATMKKYHKYVFHTMCGLPKVTIEGEKRDWENILGRLEKLKQYGVETIAWYHLLVPVISHFIKAFDDPHGSENLDFWSKVCDKDGFGSGRSYLVGWLTAFCAFDEEGKWLGHFLADEGSSLSDMATLSAADFFSKHAGEARGLVLDGASYHCIATDLIPHGYAQVNVVIDESGTEISSMMVAGQFGMQICSSRDEELSSTGVRDTVQPASGWWIFTTLPGEETRGKK